LFVFNFTLAVVQSMAYQGLRVEMGDQYEKQCTSKDKMMVVWIVMIPNSEKTSYNPLKKYYQSKPKLMEIIPKK
jgi:hypothetical protein